MKREYSIPVVAYEPYSLTSHIAGACADAGKTPIGDVEPITIDGTSVHCVDKNGITKNCSEGAHTWTVGLSGTIFADGNKEGGCTHDVYNMEQYAQLIAQSYTGGSHISGGICKDGEHFCFMGNSHEHLGSFEKADFGNYFQS